MSKFAVISKTIYSKTIYFQNDAGWVTVVARYDPKKLDGEAENLIRSITESIEEYEQQMQEEKEKPADEKPLVGEGLVNNFDPGRERKPNLRDPQPEEVKESIDEE
jgi:hypothetical protein